VELALHAFSALDSYVYASPAGARLDAAAAILRNDRSLPRGHSTDEFPHIHESRPHAARHWDEDADFEFGLG